MKLENHKFCGWNFARICSRKYVTILRKTKYIPHLDFADHCRGVYFSPIESFKSIFGKKSPTRLYIVVNFVNAFNGFWKGSKKHLFG